MTVTLRSILIVAEDDEDIDELESCMDVFVVLLFSLFVEDALLWTVVEVEAVVVVDDDALVEGIRPTLQDTFLYRTKVEEIDDWEI